MNPMLLFGYGNPGRGDDGLGPALIEAASPHAPASLICLSDMQLQVEHVSDLADMQLVLFADADMSCAAPVMLEEIYPVQDVSYTSHAMTPQALLHAFQQLYGINAPPAFLLRMRGYQFELGDAFSAQAQHNLKAALHLVQQLVESPDAEYWRRILQHA